MCRKSGFCDHMLPFKFSQFNKLFVTFSLYKVQAKT